ncbi:response regulator transcription factor [Alsobacter sp. SYSU M60028]|uniref:Response regulator transcription factor n=1 Tax=Alsobacter ponti TaxID=2962936 RepID=A0ABT1L7R6_9HYPH|nr:response regulator transcription factor [Alsobacter ponti]
MSAPRPRPTPADDAPHILVVDDDRRIRDLLSRFLSEHGYRVTTAPDAARARARLANLVFDLCVLDVMMPGENGFDLAAWLRGTSSVPIVMLTARSEGADRVRGLEIGADDYVAKPFEPRELLLRLNNILRRSAPAASPSSAPEFVRFGPFVYRPERGELRQGEEIIRITDREREMLTLLASRPGETVAREELAGSGDASNERTVDVQINRLRRKIELDPANPLHLQTVRGLGYRLQVD